MKNIAMRIKNENAKKMQSFQMQIYMHVILICMHAIPKWLEYIWWGQTKNHLVWKSICYTYIGVLFNLEKNLLHVSNWHYRGCKTTNNEIFLNELHLFKDIYNDKCSHVKNISFICFYLNYHYKIPYILFFFWYSVSLKIKNGNKTMLLCSFPKNGILYWKGTLFLNTSVSKFLLSATICSVKCLVS